jgi:hypothetical protein
MKVKTRYGDRYSPLNTHGFHTIKRDCRDAGKDENHPQGLSCLEVPNIGTLPAHYRLNIAHLVTIFVSSSDSSETHLSTGWIRQTFASNGKRRAGRDGVGEVKGPRDTASTTLRPRQLPLERAERTVPPVPSRKAGT